MSDGQEGSLNIKILFNRFVGQPHTPLHSSLFSFFLFPFAGTLVTMPPSMKTFSIEDAGVKIDVAAIEWPANATALIYKSGALVCRTADPDESKEGAEANEIRFKCGRHQVIGTSSAWQVINT